MAADIFSGAICLAHKLERMCSILDVEKSTIPSGFACSASATSRWARPGPSSGSTSNATALARRSGWSRSAKTRLPNPAPSTECVTRGAVVSERILSTFLLQALLGNWNREILVLLLTASAVVASRLVAVPQPRTFSLLLKGLEKRDDFRVGGIVEAALVQQKEIQMIRPQCAQACLDTAPQIDGAAFPSLGIQNPTLTILALTARACHHAVDR